MIVIPNYGPSSSSDPLPLVDGHAAAAPWKALESVAGGLRDVAKTAGSIALDIQGAANEEQFLAAKRQLSERQAAFEQSLLNDHDYQGYLQRAENEVISPAQNLITPDMAPVVKERLNNKIGQWASDLRIRTNAAASRKAVERATTELKLLRHAAIVNNDPDSYLNELDQAPFLTSEDRKGERIEFERDLARERLNGFIDDAPREALKELNAAGFLEKNPGWTDSDRRRAVKLAERRAQELQRDALKDLNRDIVTGRIETEEQLKTFLEGSPDIDETMHDEVLFNFHQSQPVDAETRFAITDQLNDLHDAYKAGGMSLDDYREAHDELAQVVYAFGARDGAGALRQRVHALDPAAWNGQNLQEAREQSREREISKLSKVYSAAGAFGAVDEDEREDLPPFALAEREAEILRRRERVEQRMTDWLRDPANEGKDLDAQFRKVAMEEMAGSVISGGTPSIEDRRRSLGEMLGPPSGPPGARNSTPDRPVGGSLKTMVKQFEAGGEKEGFHAKAYWDYGQWTIGYGTKSKPGEVIDKAEAERRLDAELATHRKRVEDEAHRVGMEFAPHELDALTSFDFNTGKIRQLLAGGTRSKAEIASKMLLYRNATDQRTGQRTRLRGLERRRMAEAKLFRRGWN